MTKLYFVTANYKDPLWSYSKQYTNMAVLARNKKEALEIAIPAFNSIKDEALIEDDWHDCTYSVKEVPISRKNSEVLGAVNLFPASENIRKELNEA